MTSDDAVRATMRDVRERDPLGKAALFSATSATKAPFGTVIIECSSCSRETPIKMRDLPGILWPLPVTLLRKFHTLGRCPACHERTWIRARVRF